MPQWKPRPGASYADASGEPIITASAPHAIALAMSPPVRMPPSAMTCTYTPVSSRWRMRAPAASAIAVACGTPMPSTPRLVHAWPGPTPTRMPTAPVRMRCSAVEYDAQPPTITGMLVLTDELLEVERLARVVLRHVLGRHHRALDDEQVELGVERRAARSARRAAA